MTVPLLDPPADDASLVADPSIRTDAARLASIIAAGIKSRDTVPVLGPGATTEPATVVDPAAPDAAAAPTADVTAALAAAPALTAPVVETFTDDQFGEAEKVLTELGVDLGVSRTDVPAELLPAYGRLVQSAIDLSQAELTERLSANESHRQLAELGERMEKEPEKLLLAIAITKPDIMKKVIEVFTQMEADEGYKDLVVREMQTDARDRDINRREMLLRDQDTITKSRQVTIATKTACRKLGVPYELGEKFVVRAIQAKQGQFGPGDVEAVITELKGFALQSGVKPAVAAPAKVATLAAAPGAPVAASIAPAATPPAPVLQRESGGGAFRNLVRAANSRVIAALQDR